MKILISVLVLSFGSLSFASDCLTEKEQIANNVKSGWVLDEKLEMSFDANGKLDDRVMVYKKPELNNVIIYLGCEAGKIKEVSSNDSIMSTELINDGMGVNVDKHVLWKVSDYEFTVRSYLWLSNNFGDKRNHMSFNYNNGEIIVKSAYYKESYVNCYAGAVDPRYAIEFDFQYHKVTEFKIPADSKCVEDPESGVLMNSKTVTTTTAICNLQSKIKNQKFNEVTSVDDFVVIAQETDLSCE